MLVNIKRLRDDGEATLGLLYVDDALTCFTLEDQHQDIKIQGETRIPAGHYALEPIYDSPMALRHKEKFGHAFLIGIKDVPGFTNVRMHPLNYEYQTEGCVGVGYGGNLRSTATIQHSVDGYKAFYAIVETSVENRTARLHIKDES